EQGAGDSDPRSLAPSSTPKGHWGPIRSRPRGGLSRARGEEAKIQIQGPREVRMKRAKKQATEPIRKGRTGIDGFDFITHGGLPQGRTALLTGTAGSAKTVFAAEFLAAGIRTENEAGVFVTFEEPPEDIRRNMV